MDKQETNNTEAKKMLGNFIANTILEQCAESSRSAVKKIIRLKSRRKHVLINIILKQKQKKKVVKIKNYMDTIKRFSNETFYSHFRMNRVCFNKLVSEIKPYWVHHVRGGPKISAEYALLMTLWWVVNEDSLREISDRFGISVGQVHAINLQMCKIIAKLSEKYIRWPNEQEMLEISNKFANMRQRNPFPKVVGCLDSTHIKIKSPTIDSSSYFNRKGYHSVILQGICDNNFVFRNVFFGWPGSSHDAVVWNASKIGKSLADKTIKLIEGGHLLGDSAYPLQTYLITPYRDNGYLSQNQKKFNYLHSSIRVCVEQAFGILKAKFRILNYIRINKICNIKYIVLTCIILHNFIRMNSNTETEIELNIENLNEENEYDNENEQNNVNEDIENAVRKRNVLCEWLTNL